MAQGDRGIFIIDIDGTVCEHIDNEDGQRRMLDAKPSKIQSGRYTSFTMKDTTFASSQPGWRGTEMQPKEWMKRHRVKYHQMMFNKLRKLPPFIEYHFIDDAHLWATTFKGKFTGFVRKSVEIEDFEE